jgi:peptidyl-prolyl cis-trans isomerase D
MLQNLRDYFPKWVIISLLGLLAFLIMFVGLYVPTNQGFGFRDKAIARVYGKKIRQSQLEQVYHQIRQLYVMQLGEDKVNNIPEIEQQLRMLAFQEMLSKESFDQHVYQQGYRAHPSDIQKILQQIPDFQLDNRFSPKKFTEVLFIRGLTKASFIAYLTGGYVSQQIQHAVADSTFILPKEMYKALRLINQQRDFEYVEIEARRFLQATTLIEDEAVQDYYDHHLTELRVPERVSIEYVLLSPIGEKENLNEHSSDTQANTNNAETSGKQQADLIERLTQLSYSHPMSLKEIAQEMGLEIQDTPLFDRSEKSLEITRYPEVIAAAFSESVLKGFNSPVLHLNSDRCMVLRLKEHQPLHLPSFEVVKQTIQEKLAIERAKTFAKETGEKIIEEIKQSPAVAIALPDSMTWRKVMNVSRHERNVSPEILNAAFKINQHSSTRPVMGFELSNGNYVVVRLKQVRYGKMTQPDDDQSKPSQEELLFKMGQFDNMLYRYANRARANIVISN